jgi:hypothetical protein
MAARLWQEHFILWQRKAKIERLSLDILAPVDEGFVRRRER